MSIKCTSHRRASNRLRARLLRHRGGAGAEAERLAWALLSAFFVRGERFEGAGAVRTKAFRTLFAHALLLACLSGAETAKGQDAVVVVEPSTIRSIGGITAFERDKYITIHASPFEGDLTEPVYRYVTEELGVHYGRDGGVQSGLLSKTPEDPKKPGFPDVEWMKREGAKQQKQFQFGFPSYDPKQTREVVLCTHPQWMMGMPSQDFASFGPKSPEAAAEFCAQYLKHFWDGERRPYIYEVFNEPFVHAKEIGTNVEEMSHQHLVTARRIRELVPGMLIGGYTAAWAEVEARNFEHWNNWQKKFMDIAGEEMDFFSTHLYDGKNIKGTEAERTGSNTEAILDLIDSYSFLSYGVAKPQVFSEYGRIVQRKKGTKYPYSPKRVGRLIRSLNGMNMMFMDHPDRLLKCVPFVLTIGSWTYEKYGEDEPWEYLLFRKVGDNLVITELEHFYRFWKGVDGERRVSHSTDPDIRVHAIADGLRLHVVMANLDTKARTVDLQGLADLKPAKVSLRRLTTHGEVPTFSQTTLLDLPQSQKLEVGESAMLIIDLAKTLEPAATVEEKRVYATSYLQAIEQDKPISFVFKNVPTGQGTAYLRLAIGREQDRQRTPSVVLNGQSLEVPTDWAGGDQAGRKMFFGLLEIPVPMALVSNETRVEIGFPDSGGKVASAVLQVNLRNDH